jgi:cephalosporin hydroxylase
VALSDRIMYDLTLWCNSRGYSEPSLGFYSAPNMPLYRHVLQHPLEIKAYIDVLEPLDPREITLEIGLHRGGTHFVWQQLFQEVISVDNNYWWCCKASVEFPSVRSKIVYGNSQDVECVQTVAHILDGRLVDHLFIDGEHIYERIFSDLLNYSKFVRPGGIIAFHDSRDSAVFPVMEDLQYGRLTGWPATKMSEINAPEGDQPPGITYFYGDRPPGICYFYMKE